MKTLQVYILLFCMFFNTQTDIVYITKTGKKYHKEVCNYLKYSKSEIDLKKAKELGYLACKVCKPNNSITQKSNFKRSITSKGKVENTTYKSNLTVQCSGKTKSNKRCKRKTKNSNGRCYQH